MLKRIAVLAGALVALAAVPAAADQYPPDDNALTVSDASPCPGDAVTITAKAYSGSGAVTVTLDQTILGTPTPTADGTATLDATLPEGTSHGSHTITSTGMGLDGEQLSLSSTIEVVSCDAAPTTTVATGGSGSLPTTGSNGTLTLLRIGLALAALGGVLLAVATKRRRSARARHAPA
jgi:LPXTG-motif cell wall-anchored protein